MKISVRPAQPQDYRTFARLMPELATGDALPSEARFIAEMLVGTWIAEDEDGTALGYAIAINFGATTHIRHLVTAPEARRQGVGAALLKRIETEARAQGSTAWYLNVKPENVAAIALYRNLGLRPLFESQVLRLKWAEVTQRCTSVVQAEPIEPEQEAHVEDVLKLTPRQLAHARRQEGRVVRMLREEGEIVGGAVFHPHFPSVYPFRVTRPELALAFLHTLHPYAWVQHNDVNVVVEGQPEVAEALLTAGAQLHLALVRFHGTLAK